MATESLRRELAGKGFRNLHIWARGVDTELFNPHHPPPLDLPRPVFLHVGRMAVEKNVEAFLDMDLPGSKLVVGDGPQLDDFRARYPGVTFTGAKSGQELAALYAMGDVFVFPSRTDTFGLVLLEAMASGVPVAAYPVTGPKDIIGESSAGVVDENLRKAALACLDLAGDDARARAMEFSWQACARQFMDAVYKSYGIDQP